MKYINRSELGIAEVPPGSGGQCVWADVPFRNKLTRQAVAALPPELQALPVRLFARGRNDEVPDHLRASWFHGLIRRVLPLQQLVDEAESKLLGDGPYQLLAYRFVQPIGAAELLDTSIAIGTRWSDPETPLAAEMRKKLTEAQMDALFEELRDDLLGGLGSVTNSEAKLTNWDVGDNNPYVAEVLLDFKDGTVRDRATLEFYESNGGANVEIDTMMAPAAAGRVERAAKCWASRRFLLTAQMDLAALELQGILKNLQYELEGR